MSATHSPPKRALSVLLVDDDAGDVMMIEEALQQCGNVGTVHAVHDGIDALAYLRQLGRFISAARPDVILLDLNMPRMGGHELLAEIKADLDLRTIPIVVLTTSRAPADIRTSYDLHANAYVTKPADLDVLLHVISRIGDFFSRIAVLAD